MARDRYESDERGFEGGRNRPFDDGDRYRSDRDDEMRRDRYSGGGGYTGQATGSGRYGAAFEGGMTSGARDDDFYGTGGRGYGDDRSGMSSGGGRGYGDDRSGMSSGGGRGYGDDRSGMSSGSQSGRSSGYGWGRDEGRSGGDRGRDFTGYSQSRGYEGQGSGRGMMDRAADEISSWFGDQDAQRRREEDHRGKGPRGYQRSDQRIQEDVNDKLTDDYLVDASSVEVQVSEGEVTLSGEVPSKAAKRHAEDCADRVSGVKHVQNNLRVSSSSSTGSSTAGTQF